MHRAARPRRSYRPGYGTGVRSVGAVVRIHGIRSSPPSASRKLPWFHDSSAARKSGELHGARRRRRRIRSPAWPVRIARTGSTGGRRRAGVERGNAAAVDFAGIVGLSRGTALRCLRMTRPRCRRYGSSGPSRGRTWQSGTLALSWEQAPLRDSRHLWRFRSMIPRKLSRRYFRKSTATAASSWVIPRPPHRCTAARSSSPAVQ